MAGIGYGKGAGDAGAPCVYCKKAGPMGKTGAIRAGFGGRGAVILALCALMVLSACGGGGRGWFSGFGGPRGAELVEQDIREERIREFGNDGSLLDLFTNRRDPGVTLEVNRYLWVASLEVLDFLPVETVDPFTGVFTTGFGTPPGGGAAYRATVHVTDSALDARSLNVALITRSGPASTATVRAVEDAILTRARQIRIRERGL